MARVLVAYSLKDPASLGIARMFVEVAECRECEPVEGSVESYVCLFGRSILAGFGEDVTELEKLNNVKNVDRIVVLSRHSSESRIPILSVHTPGNPGPSAPYGGRPWEVCVSDPLMGWLLIKLLREYAANEGIHSVYDVVYESTHHGPSSVSKPITFVEIGSDESRWRDPRAQRVVAKAVAKAIERLDRSSCIPIVVFGGPHYQKRITEKALNGNICPGHMVSKNVIKEIDSEENAVRMARLVIERTPGVRKVLLEKVRSVVRKGVESVAQELGLPIERI